ncbi:MAG TPA: nuclear transport factor 2 family protein, partial [Xanthobacteraceae bacterium]
MAQGKVRGAVQCNFLIAGFALLGMLSPASAEDIRPAPDDAAIQTMQKQFAEAYNRKDADAMANFFSANGIRVTPNGVLQGRDAIRSDLQKALDMGLRDYTVQRTISRKEGNLVFDAGEW